MTTLERAEAFKREWEAALGRRGCHFPQAGSIPDVADLMPLLDAAVAEEREACARLADLEANRSESVHGVGASQRIARAIRAKGGET